MVRNAQSGIPCEVPFYGNGRKKIMHKKVNFLDDIFMGDEAETTFISGIFSPEEQKIKAKEANLVQLWKIHNYIDVPTLISYKFFNEVKYESDSQSLGIYLHRILQYNFTDFFIKQKGYEIVDEFSITENNIAVAIRETIKSSPDEIFRAYSNAYILLHNKETGHKAIVIVQVQEYDNSAWYNVMRTSEDNLLYEWIEYSKKNNFYNGKKISADYDFLSIDNHITWDSVVIPEKTRRTIKNSVDGLLSVREILNENGISIKRGIIISGSPGIGKTLICKILAKEIDISVIYVLPSHIRNIKDISRICDMAQDIAPTLLIFEDIDYLAENREDYNGNGGLVIELMNRLDGVENFDNVITIATTNMIEKVENAIKNRPGRFDQVITLGKPDKQCRKKMIELFASKVKLGKDVDIDDLAIKTDKMSGAYISYIIEAAAVEAACDGNYNRKNKKITILQKHIELVLQELHDKDLSSFPEELGSSRIVGFGSKNNAEL